MRLGLVIVALLGGCTANPVRLAPPAAPVRNLDIPTELIRSHNIARAKAGVAPLIWDPQLAQAALAYARQLASSGEFRHSPRQSRPGQGENLWMGTRGAFAVSEMVGSWTSEGRYFRPGIFPAVSATGNWPDVGHYTQMIWPTTTRMGCAIASSVRSDFLVCRYAPAGNIDGRPVP